MPDNPSTPKPIVLAWGARQLTPSLHHIAFFTGVRVLEVRGHSAFELRDVLDRELAGVDPDTPVMITTDDLVPSQQAIDVLFAQYAADPGVWCGWSNVDFTHTLTNVQIPAPHKPQPESARDYTLLDITDVAIRTEPFRVGFNGFSLLTMPAHRWIAPETRLAPCGSPPWGWASDWAMCWRLAQQDVPIMCDPRAYAPHIKVSYLDTDTASTWKRVDLTNKSVRWVDT